MQLPVKIIPAANLSRPIGERRNTCPPGTIDATTIWRPLYSRADPSKTCVAPFTSMHTPIVIVSAHFTLGHRHSSGAMQPVVG